MLAGTLAQLGKSYGYWKTLENYWFKSCREQIAKKESRTFHCPAERRKQWKSITEWGIYDMNRRLPWLTYCTALSGWVSNILTAMLIQRGHKSVPRPAFQYGNFGLGVEFVPGNRSGALCTCVIPNRRRLLLKIYQMYSCTGTAAGH